MQHFTDLRVWKNGLELACEIYALTRTLPKEEQYGITSQLRRSTTSILANIAEGFGRFTYRDKAAKYTIARGECSEVEAFLLITVAIELTASQDIHKALLLVQQERQMLSGLIAACKRNAPL
jgi:four helix bundle protein